jgi:hypothetical protein
MDPNNQQPPQPVPIPPPVDLAQTPPPNPTGTNTLSVVGLVFAFIAPLVGLVLSIIGLTKSKKNHQSTGIAIAGIIVSSVFMLLVFPIMVALVLSTTVGIQQKARNTEREVDIKTLYGQVEAYYGQTGKYPSLNDMNSSSWREANLKSVDPEAFVDPKGTSPNLVSIPAANTYAYNATDDNGNSCDNVSTICVKYILTATLEAGGTFSKSNL